MIALVATTLPLSLRAQVTPTPDGPRQQADSIRLYHLQGVVVTTTRSAAARSETPQKIEVIGGAQLLASPGTTAAEALRGNTPLDILAYPGLLSAISFRGFRPQLTGLTHRTLVLIDGRPAGTNNVALLNTAALESVEILRGPASTLYGSSAMAGVVNFLTRRSTTSMTGETSLSLGTFGSYEARARAGGPLGDRVDFDFSLAAAGQKDGYRVGQRRGEDGDSLRKTLPDGASVRVGWARPDSVLSFARFGSRSGTLRLGVAPAPAWRLDLSGEIFDAPGVENPGDLNVTDYDSRTLKDVRRGSLDLAARGALASTSLLLRSFTAFEEVDYFSAPTAPTFVNFRTPNRTSGAQIQGAVRFAGGELTLGVDHTLTDARSEAFLSDGVRSSPFSPDVSVASSAAFAVARLLLLQNDALAVSLGSRLDRVSYDIEETPFLADYPANTERHLVATPSFGVRYSVRPGLELYGNIGRAFATPDPFQVAGYHERSAGEGRSAVFVSRGDPDLDPETSTGVDVGVFGSFDRFGLEFDATYFTNRVGDRIGTRFEPGAPGQLTPSGDTILSVTTYANSDRAELNGFEGRISLDVVRTQVAQVGLFANGTWMTRAEERLAATDAWQRIKNVADVTAIFGTEFSLGTRTSVRVTGRYVGERVDSDYVAWWAPGEVVYPAYFVGDFLASTRLPAGLSLAVEIGNVTDESYFEVRGYDMPGRSARIHLQKLF